MSHWNFIGDALFSPDRVRSDLAEGTPSQKYGAVIAVIVFLFAAYVAFFTFPRPIISVKDTDPLNPYETLLSKITLGVIAAVLFGAWYAFDRIWLAYLAGGPRSEFNPRLKSALVGSYVPLIVLLGFWSVVRVASGGSYLSYGLLGVPAFTVGVTLAWHYSLLWYWGHAMVPAVIPKTRFRQIFLCWMATLGVLLAMAVLCLPYAFRSTPLEALGSIF